MTAGGWRNYRSYLEFLRTATPQMTPWPKRKSLPFECWLNVSKITRPDPRPSPSALLRDTVAFDQGASRLRGVAERRVAAQAPVGFTSHA